MNYAWNWGIFFEPAPDGSPTYAHMILAGLSRTIIIAACAWTLALLIGIPTGILRHIGGLAGHLGRAYVEIFRNIPLLAQMFLWYFVLPELLPEPLKSFFKQSSSAPLILATLSLGFYTAARIAEQVRAGLNSIPPAQASAGAALGLHRDQIYRYVLIPRAFRVILPSLTSESINIVKNSAVALTIGVMELTSSARTIQEFSFQIFEPFIVVTIVYLIMNTVIIALMKLTARRTAVPGIGSSLPRSS